MLLTTIRKARQLTPRQFDLRPARSDGRREAVRRAAFTLLEVLIVVAILVILASAASIALFRYLEDAKVGRAKNDMRVIEQAINKYYLEHTQWPPEGPDGLVAIAPQLQQGREGLIDPWGGQYFWELITMQDETDGTTKQRPVVYCQPPDQAKPRIQWPER